EAQRKAAVEIPETTSPEATPEQKAAAAAAATKPGDKATVRVPYVPEIVKQQIRDQVKEEVLNQARRERWGEPGVLPEWIRALTWSGDLRLRGETDLFPTGSEPNGKPTDFDSPPFYYNMNDTQTTRNRVRLRARLGLEGKFSDHWSAGIRLATGGAGGGSNPSSENATLGNYDTRLAIGLDRAYLRYQPVSWASVTGGRFGNPFFTPTDLVWCDTVSLEGLVTKFSGELSDSVDGVLIAGAFPVQLKDNQSFKYVDTSFDKWLYGYQAGLHWQFATRDDLKLAVAFYDYHRVEGVAASIGAPKQYDSTAAGFRQKGNQTFDIETVIDTPGSTTPPAFIGLVSKFRELNFSTAVDVGEFGPTHVIFSGDFVRNLGFHAKEIQNRVQFTTPDMLRARVTGYQFRLLVGRDKVAVYGDWQAYAGYRHVERDAVLDAFTDTDFHLGGTDAKGYFVGARYGVAKNTAVGLRWLSADRIEAAPPLAIDVLQLDLTASF
ncbi:MAG TPA: putative porin, partial [Nevskia sp.]|nr:putative porin [Nevskia sp.]